MNILDVEIVELTVHEDDRGYLFEVIHKSDDFVGGKEQEIKQVYVVGDRESRIVRAFHKHRTLHDWFCIVKGAAKFVLIDDREESLTYHRCDIVVLSDKQERLLVVPPGVYHGWMSLQSDTILLSSASQEYDKKDPDEERVPPNRFNKLIGRNPWEIEFK